MRSITLNILLAAVAKANLDDGAAKPVSNTIPVDKLISKLVDGTLVDLRVRASKTHFRHAALDDSTIWKNGGHLMEQPQAAPARQLQDQDASAMQEQEQEQDAAIETSKEPEVQKPDDSLSIWVGNVDYATTAEELHEIFSTCGTINHITIKTDKDGNPKAFAYVEFLEASAVDLAVQLDATQNRGRPLKVSRKRTNLPGVAARGAGRGRFGYPPYGMMPMMGGPGMPAMGNGMPMMMPMMMPMGMMGGRGGRRGARGMTRGGGGGLASRLEGVEEASDGAQSQGNDDQANDV